MGNRINELGWGERLALVDHFDASDDAACAAFNCTADELATARELAGEGHFGIGEEFDPDMFDNVFASVQVQVQVPDNATSVKRPTRKRARANTESANTPEANTTDANTEAAPKKRGRKGSKIANAFAAVPSEPTDAEAFAAEHNVSLNVLRQGKRFDSEELIAERGRVRIRKIDGNMMIFREAPAES